MPLKKRHHIRSSDIRNLVQKLKPKLGEEIEKTLDGKVETAELDSGEEVILVDNKPILVKDEGEYIPLIFSTDKLDLKKVMVDMGAVKPVTDGADVMAPGVLEVEENVDEGEIVAVQDEENQKTIAIGKTLEKGTNIIGDEGKVIKNLHYAGDDFWSLQEEL